MAGNLFPGKNQEWLEARLDPIQEALVSAVASVGEGDNSATSRRMSDLETMRDNLIAALATLDPETYKASKRVSRTSAKYTGML